MSKVRSTDSKGFKALMKDAKKRNRVPINKLLKDLDIDGVHIVEFELVHNDVEVRCLWLCKIDGKDEPMRVWMDNGFKALKKHTEFTSAGGE